MINVLITADSRYQVDKEFLRQVAISTIESKRVKGKVEVSISILGNRAMAQLNKKYRNIASTTDVLAFPQEETTPVRNVTEHTRLRASSAEAAAKPEQGFGGGRGKVAGFVQFPDKFLRLGDVIISYPQALAQAAEVSVPIEEELAILVEHGIYHLLGIHHPEE